MVLGNLLRVALRLIECCIVMTWKRHLWVVFTAGLILTCVVAALNFPHSHILTAFGDITQFLLVGFATGLMVSNAVSSRGQARGFWFLMAAGCGLWTTSLGAWTVFEVLQRREVPEPFFGDVILFIHIVPFMAAVALRPHRPQEEKRPLLQHTEFSDALDLVGVPVCLHGLPQPVRHFEFASLQPEL